MPVKNETKKNAAFKLERGIWLHWAIVIKRQYSGQSMSRVGPTKSAKIKPASSPTLFC
jgi:hypothetical protein